MEQSDSINDLAVALVKVQGALGGAKKDSKNPFFNSDYADLKSVWECCRDLLSKNGLCVIQTNGGTAESPSVITTLAHISGQWIRGELHMTPDKKGPQGTGSAITYARRYALAAIIGIYQADDDAEGATDRNKKQSKAAKPTSQPTDPILAEGSKAIIIQHFIDKGIDSDFKKRNTLRKYAAICELKDPNNIESIETLSGSDAEKIAGYIENV